MIAARLTALGALALVLTGCTAVSSWWRGSDARQPTALTEIRASVTPRAAWTASVGKSGGYPLHPDVDGGRVYAASADGTITVLDEAKGTVIQRIETKKRISGGLAVTDGTILAGTLKGEILAYDASGKALWSTPLAGEVIAPAAVSRKVAVVRTSDGRIFGLSLTDGKRQWVYQRPAPSLLLRTDAGVFVQGGDVVAGYPGGKLIALDLDDGKLTWEVTVTAPRGATELERISDVAGVPTIDGGRICAGAFQGKIGCFDIQSRNMLWSRDISSARSLAVDGKNLYVADDNGHVHAVDKNSGTSVWKQDKLAYRRLTEPVVVGGHVVVGDGMGYLHVISASDGALIGRLATDGSAIQALEPAAGGLAVQTAGGSVVMVKL